MRLKVGLAVLCATLVAVGSVGCPVRTATLRVVNESSRAIVEVNCVLQSDTSGWGSNLITSDIPAGGSRDIAGFSSGVYKARAVSSEADEVLLSGFEMNAGQTFTWTISDPPPGK